MKRWLPFPLMSALLLILWLLLNQTLSLGQILLGSLAALIGGWALTLLELPNIRVRRPAARSDCRLRCWRTSFDRTSRSPASFSGSDAASGGPASSISRSTFETRMRWRRSACIITSTPGTLWVGFDATSGTLTIHVST